MRIISWNLNHRAGAKDIPDELLPALLALSPDLIVLTEFVDAPKRRAFYEGLADNGFSYVVSQLAAKRQNQVLIASKLEISTGDIKSPAVTESFPSNTLHIRLRDPSIDILGIRIPDYSETPVHRRTCWDWLMTTAEGLKDGAAIVIGDFNTDPTYTSADCGPRIREMVDNGWQLAAPATGVSYWTLTGHGKRIDHAFLSQAFKISNTQYLEKSGETVMFGRNPKGLSDHAPLLVDFELKAEASVRISKGA